MFMGRVLSSMEQFVLTLLLMLGNIYAVVLLITKVCSMLAHLLGCVGAGSQQTWQDAVCWACCGPLKLAATARKGFQVPSPPPAPSAPLLDHDAQEGGAGGAAGSPPSDPASKPFMKWKSSKKSKRKAQAPAAPGSSEESRTGHLKPRPGSTAPPPPLAEPRKRTAPDPLRLPPVKASVQPPTRGRSVSAPRRSSRQEEVEILLPADELATDLAKVFFKRVPT